MSTIIKKHDPRQEYFFAEGCFITELSNSIDDEDVSIAKARVEPGVTTKWHYLLDTIERYVILEGVGRVEVGDNAAEDVAIGDVVIIPQKVRQRICNTGKDDLIFLAICSPRFINSNYVSL